MYHFFSWNKKNRTFIPGRRIIYCTILSSANNFWVYHSAYAVREATERSKKPPFSAEMAIQGHSSSLFLTTPSPKLFSSSSLKKTPFLGSPFSASFSLSKPYFQSQSLRRTNWAPAVRCQNKTAVHIPLDQRWMFEESEVNGPVS